MTVEKTLEFRLEEWERDARTLATCVACYGGGEDCHAPGRTCPACKGSGRAPREPHVLELVDLLRRRDAENEQLARDRAAEQRRADRAEPALVLLGERVLVLEAELREERIARAEQADRAFSAEARAAACAEAVETRSALLGQLEAAVAARHAAEAFSAATVERIMRAENEGDALRLEVERLRGEVDLWRRRAGYVAGELNRARRQERDE